MNSVFIKYLSYKKEKINDNKSPFVAWRTTIGITKAYEERRLKALVSSYTLRVELSLFPLFRFVASLPLHK